jgi:hypothetical protein
MSLKVELKPGERLIRELRMLLQRFECSDGLGIFLELHHACAHTELRFRGERRLRIFLRERSKLRGRLALPSFVEREHRAVKCGACDVLGRRLVHERFERHLLIRLQDRRIFQSLLCRLFLILVTAQHSLVLRARLRQFAA